jgi:hypothetical protein
MTDEEIIDKFLTFSLEVHPARPNFFAFIDSLIGKTDDANYFRIQNRLFDEELCDNDFMLIQEGRRIVQSGGYLAEMQRLSVERERQKRKEEIAFQLSEKQLEITTWLYRTRWWPLRISVAAFLISLASLILHFFG